MSADRREVPLLRLSEDEFEELVVAALDTLPEDLLELMDNIEVTVERAPSRQQMRRVGLRSDTLLGFYEGIPLTARNSSSYSLVVPDKITIFQRPIEGICSTHDEVVAQVRKTVIHEVAHHFGIGEERLRELGWG
ncbi:MAG TPA: metallopeptidase family protein [Thermomicrobiales bacterium]|nr:metallopeptidase family protein [Thermomicrobiales bacterium]